MVIMSEDAQKLLDRYRELYNEWQSQINDKKNLSDECLLMIALDEAIAYMHLKLADNRKGVD
nr:MAG TPA: hypothetical protein [Caudoviricetes sp.]